MSQPRTSEAPLDLLNAGRDELIDGRGPAQVVSQDETQSEGLQSRPVEAPSNHHSPQRELNRQSAVLKNTDK